MKVAMNTCTKETPYNNEEGRWIHPEAKELYFVEYYPGGDVAIYVCPICNHRWKQELPQ